MLHLGRCDGLKEVAPSKWNVQRRSRRRSTNQAHSVGLGQETDKSQADFNHDDFTSEHADQMFHGANTATRTDSQTPAHQRSVPATSVRPPSSSARNYTSTSTVTRRRSLSLILLSCMYICFADNHQILGSQLHNEATGAFNSEQHGPAAGHHQADSQQEPGGHSQAPTASAATTSTATANIQATCFGGLQTFEKISMSSFENPAGANSGASSNGAGGGGSIQGGILVQQDDQALTSECINLCRSQSNCLSFVIDYNKFECKSYATTQQELQQEFANRFQSARSTTTGNGTGTPPAAGDSTSEQLNGGGYQASASSSSINFQQLLPSASSNYFEKICLDGVANRQQFGDVCGPGRLWTIERVVDSFLDGFVEKEVTNVNGKDECSKLCLFESQFVCRSADYDQQSRLCRLSKEDRRTQPQAMRYVANSNRQYLENQCATPGPSSCVYETRRNLGIISMDALKFAQTPQDCQMKCNQESTFNCRSYSFNQQRCFLSGDDSVSLNSNLIKLPQKQGWLFGEKKCLVELCTKGVFSYERITGYTLRSALSTSIDLMMPGASSASIKSVRGPSGRSPGQWSAEGQQGDSLLMEALQLEASQRRVRRLMPPPPASNGSASLASAMMQMMMTTQPLNAMDPLQEAAADTYTSRRARTTSAQSSNLAITEHCRHSCDLGYLNCPAFTIDYKNNRCQRLDRNSQGRHHELVARDGFAFYEKICLRVPEIMSMCQDKFWIFERVVGYELAPRLYDKSLKFVQSRRDCEEYCLEEKQFQCRSALYNDETSDCKLSRYDRRLALQEGAYYGNYNTRVSYLENNCVRDRQLETRKQCRYEQAKDEPAYPTFTERIELASAATGDNLDPRQSVAASNHSLASSGRYGAQQCEQLCNDNSKFECHSFGYYASTAQCFLSGDDSVSAGELATTPSTGFVYYEKKCRVNMNDTTDASDEPPNAPQTTTPMSNGAQNPYFQPPLQPQSQTPTMLTTSTMANTPADEGARSQPAGGSPTQNGTGRPAAGQMVPASETTNPDLYKCGVGHSFVYQRISGFEPVGGYLTLLLKNNEQPGIVAECSELCRRAFECRAFVVDYNENQCFAMLENSSVGLLNLRQTLAKDYFEGFCVAEHLLQTSASSNCRNRTWIMDKIVDQAVFGVQHQKLLVNSDRVQCRRACLEERLFVCKSAMFDSSTAECKLYTIDRESIPQMRLLFTKGVDFFENQCQITSSSCPYDAIERDLTITTITKSVQARSTFDCELACNSEVNFNCRSYTYLDQYPSLPNLCLLSSDSRSTSQRGAIREHQRTLYAERNCYYRRPRFPGGSGAGNRYENFQPLHMADVGPSYTPGPPVNPSLAPPSTPMSPFSPVTMSDLGPPLPAPELVAPSREQEATSPNQPPSMGYDIVGPLPALASQPCEPHQFTFERTFGYDLKLAFKERAAIAPTVGIAAGCQQECLRRADKCQSFVVDYALPYQSCFLLETQAGANKRLLVRSPNSAYFEKVCLPRTGLSGELPTDPAYNHAPLRATGHGRHGHLLDPVQSLDISPSYSQEPWSVQGPPAQASQLPYYLQQQSLVQNYPSRACAKLWSFERFVNHNFTAPVDRAIENSLTRAHCETQCLNEASFSCRAATYDYVSKTCRLFKSTRRTMTSHFTDLDLDSSSVGGGSILALAQTDGPMHSHPGTAHVLDTSEPILAAASSALGANELANTRRGGARQLSQQQQQPSAEPTVAGRNIDYLENTCTPEPSSCQYRQIYDQFSPYIDKVNHASSLADCQRQCDQERLFTCKSINFDASSKNCMLINEDLISLARNQQQTSAAGGANSPLLPKRNTVYSEKGNCEMISVQCNSQEMLVAINFDAPFRGRIMAKGNPEQCYILGDGQTSLQFSIVFGPKCNSRQEGHNTFVNEVLIQQHPVIMTESDKTVRVMCAFEAPDQTITLKSAGGRDNKTAGIDVGTPSDSIRTRHDKQQFNSVISNKAPPPSVVLRILDQNGRDASMINLGDDLMLKIQMQMMDGKGSALGIFARNLAARSSNGESLLLIDSEGCPVDPQVFPALAVDQKDGRSLYSTFKAFRFPSSGLVNFEVQIRFCPERCQPIECNRSNQKLLSYGRRRKRQANEMDYEQNMAPAAVAMGRTPILQSVTGQTYPSQPAAPVAGLDSLSTVMKPGKAFEYVRKLMLAQPEQVPTSTSGSGPNSDAASSSVMPSEVGGSESDGHQSDQGRQQEPASTSNAADAQSSSGRDGTGNSGQQSEDFVSHSQQSASFSGADGTVTEPELPDQQQQQPLPADQFSQPDPGQAKDVEGQFSPSNSPVDLPSAHRKKSVQVLVGDPAAVKQANGQLEDGSVGQHLKPIRAPYNNFEPNTETQSPVEDIGSSTGQSDAHQQQEGVGLTAATSAATSDLVSQTRLSSNDDADEHQKRARQPNLAQPKDLPLRFSILVAENQLPSANGLADIEQPPTIMNSTSMDMDHIVIPGKRGQFEDSSQFGSNSLGESPATTSSYADSSQSMQNQPMTIKPNQRQREPNKRNASYEQTFDALPSNSVASEIHINHHHHNNPQRNPSVDNHRMQSPTRPQATGHLQQPNQHHSSTETPAESAASHDCQAELTGRGKLRAIIWTGGIVISLNVCLVVLSLFLYFRKLHLRQNHTIVGSSSDCGTTSRSDGLGLGGSSSRFSSGTSQWPSVILKSKNKLGTSLKTHEQFFCKLNSKPVGLESRLEQEFNWPNMSATASSRSTLSSLASPIPSTSIRINQMLPSLKSGSFDGHSSLRKCNFIPDHETHKGIDESDMDGEYTSRYTNNIDVLRSERF